MFKAQQDTNHFTEREQRKCKVKPNVAWWVKTLKRNLVGTQDNTLHFKSEEHLKALQNIMPCII